MSITTIPILGNLQGSWDALSVDLVGKGVETIRDVYPFISVTDLKRLIWIHMAGDPRWAPERVFLGVRTATGIRPIEFHWPASVMGESVSLPDPLTFRAPNPALVDEAGIRKPIGPTMIGALILESALSIELAVSDVIPTLVAIPLIALAPAESDELTSSLYGGYYQLYFPWLTAPGQVLDAAVPSTVLSEEYAAAVLYSEDRIGRIGAVQAALAAERGGTSMTMNTMVRLRWVLPPPSEKPTSLEHTFYGLRASATIPFIRFFPAGKQSPLLKLGLKPDGTPFLDNDKVFAQYLNQAAPSTTSSVILARIPIASEHVERGAAFTLYMFEDGTTDISLEVPQRGATYIAAVAADAQRTLRSVVSSIGFDPETTTVLHDLHATYKWKHPEPRRSAPLSAAALNKRIAALTPFFQAGLLLKNETALAVCQWRAVSNYESESTQFAYITQMFLKKGHAQSIDPEEGMAAYSIELGQAFGITQEAAVAIIERWIEHRAAAVAPAVGPSAGLHAVPRHSTGARIAISGAHPEYTIEIQDVDSYTELQRIVSVVGVLLGADITITPPAEAIQVIATTVSLGDAAMVEAAGGEIPDDIDLGEMDPAMANLLADLGIGADETEMDLGSGPGPGPSIVIAEVAPPVPSEAPIPDLAAAVAAVEEECRGIPWTPGEPPLKITADYYMAKLKKEDKVLFG